MNKNPLWDNIPQEMCDLPNWIYWKLEDVNGRMTKVPYNARSSFKASTTNPATWSTFDQAVRSSVNGNGIGFVFTLECGLVGLDMDHEIDPGLIDWFNSYAEKSQSGKGAHVIMKGKLPKRFNDTTEGVGRRGGNYELYCQGRYFVVTGDKLRDYPIVECQDKINEFIKDVFPAPQPITVNLSELIKPTQTDINLIDRIRNSEQADKFNALWSGDCSAYNNDHSRADAALLSILRFWTGGNMSESFALFRQSGLMRPKAERKDYMLMTWKSIDNGEVFTATEPVPAQFIQQMNQSTPPWRKITIAHVEQAIAGTILDPMCKALCAPTDPPLPLEVGLAKALALCGCALSGKAKTSRGIADYINKGNELSRIRILTGGGQTPNFWTLLVGESASGKDIGGISEKAAMQFKWLIGSAGSEEGIADSYCTNPVGLMSISEMMNFLDSRHWQSRAAGFLTHAFNKGWFSHAMSKKKDTQPRETDYCFPNIIASVQPGILQSYASQTHLDSGFLGRFIVIQMPQFVVYPKTGKLIDEIKTVVLILKTLNEKEGDVTPPQRYNQDLNDMFAANKAHPAPSWKRLSSEYYPRLALLLSFPLDDTSTSVQITEDGWRRASTIVQYLFAQAESVLGGLCFDAQQAKFEGLCTKILSIIHSEGGSCPKSIIGALVGHGSISKDRDNAITELETRGKIIVDTHPTGGRSSAILRIVK